MANEIIYYQRTENDYQFSGSEKYNNLRVGEHEGKIVVYPPTDINWDYCIFIDREKKQFHIEELDGA